LHARLAIDSDKAKVILPSTTHVPKAMIAKTATKAIGRTVAIATVTAMDPETVTGIENDVSVVESAGGTKMETRR
jgi:hypothetical protein